MQAEWPQKPIFVPGKVPQIRGKLVHFPGKDGRGMQAEWPQKRLPDFVPGKVPQIRGKLVHFPGINSENGGIINIFEGKVYRIRSKLVHFPLFHMRQTMSHKRNKQRPVNAPLRHIRPCGTSNTSGTSDSAEHQACETCG